MDLRVERIFSQEMKGDTSFQDKNSILSFLFGGNMYSRKEIRDAWNSGIKTGIEIGLRRASLEGQIIELTNNTPDGPHKEFMEKFLQLAQQYNCGIQYHPEVGLKFITLYKTHK